MPDTTTPAEALLRSVIDAYRAYRRRGVAPAPNQYGDLVRAIAWTPSPQVATP